ncbi:hypothetical protein C3B55_00846 [Candidatus Pseudomonas adelgestsugas]|uniref:Uncharacterized protein n=1 Tax=Candidatus Pseudomonas adelgestsugas TaxID=1302376 RepID=A0ABX5R9R9_9PSED|nr:hypothetical protein C3B55_00846 [Candidatus Pseudomonas adelgestsugas]
MNAYLLLPHSEKFNILFIFTLYQSAKLILHNIECDKRIKSFDSLCFEKVIITQQVIYHYITDQHLHQTNKIEMIFGVAMLELTSKQLLAKKSYCGGQ